MRRKLIYPAGLIVLATACDGPAQPLCGGALVDACRKASDLAYSLGVQIADESSDGNPMLGDVGTMGATGKAALSLRVTARRPRGAQMDGVTARSDGREAASNFPAERGVATAISISGAVGAWSGMRVGSTRVGGMDLLGNFVIATSGDRGDIHLNGPPNLIGVGVRLGVIEETPSLPAVSLTSMLRFASKFSAETSPIATETQESVVLKIENADMNTVDYRVTASKKFGAFGLSGGIGRNQYNFQADYVVEGTGTLGTGNQHASSGVTRTNAFVGAAFTHKRLTFGAELGRLTGGDGSKTINTFGEGTAATRTYLSLGIRIPTGRRVPQ